jgi:hypothetical protein
MSQAISVSRSSTELRNCVDTSTTHDIGERSGDNGRNKRVFRTCSVKLVQSAKNADSFWSTVFFACYSLTVNGRIFWRLLGAFWIVLLSLSLYFYVAQLNANKYCLANHTQNVCPSIGNPTTLLGLYFIASPVIFLVGAISGFIYAPGKSPKFFAVFSLLPIIYLPIVLFALLLLFTVIAAG